MGKNVQSRSFHAKRNMAAGSFNRLLYFLFGFLNRSAAIRILGAEYMGVGSLFSSILQVLSMAELGFSTAVVFSLYKPVAEHDTEMVCALLNFYRRVYKIVGSVILVSGTLITPFITYLIKGTYPRDLNIHIVFYIYLVNTCVSYLGFAYKNVLFAASQRQDVISVISTAVMIGQYAVQISVLLLAKNYYVYICCYVLFTMIQNLAVEFISRRDYPDYRCIGKISDAEKKDISKRIRGLAIGQITKVSRNSFDSIVLSAYLGLMSVTVYSNYYYIFSSVLSVIGIAVTSVSAGIGNSVATESVDKNHNDFMKIYYLFSWIGSWCTICMACLYQPFMKLWMGTPLMLPFNTMILFCVYFYVMQTGQVRAMYQNAAGIWWEGRWLEIAEMMSNLLFNLIFGYFWGIDGILTATILTVSVFGTIGRTQLLYRYYFKYPVGKFFGQTFVYLAVTVITGVVTYAACQKICREGMAEIAEKGCICIILPNLLFLAFSLSVKQHRQYFTYLLKVIAIRRME